MPVPCTDARRRSPSSAKGSGAAPGARRPSATARRLHGRGRPRGPWPGPDHRTASAIRPTRTLEADGACPAAPGPRAVSEGGQRGGWRPLSAGGKDVAERTDPVASTDQIRGFWSFCADWLPRELAAGNRLGPAQTGSRREGSGAPGPAPKWDAGGTTLTSPGPAPPSASGQHRPLSRMSRVAGPGETRSLHRLRSPSSRTQVPTVRTWPPTLGTAFVEQQGRASRGETWQQPETKLGSDTRADCSRTSLATATVSSWSRASLAVAALRPPARRRQPSPGLLRGRPGEVSQGRGSARHRASHGEAPAQAGPQLRRERGPHTVPCWLGGSVPDRDRETL